MARIDLNCQSCGTLMQNVYHTRRFCLDCANRRYADTGAALASAEINRAVALGLIPPVSQFACVDCGKPARAYDHRDYGKPFAVEPVCIPCNLARGPALNSVSRIRTVEA